jgi:hypothetical protein
MLPGEMQLGQFGAELVGAVEPFPDLIADYLFAVAELKLLFGLALCFVPVEWRVRFRLQSVDGLAELESDEILPLGVGASGFIARAAAMARLRNRCRPDR